MCFPIPRLILCFAILAILVRSMVPMGYMPEMGNGKIFHITICTMDGPKDIALDDKGQPASDTSHQVKEKCAFSLLNHSPFNTHIATAYIVTPYQHSALQRVIIKDHVARHSVFYSPAQPRAPPVVI